MIGPVDPTRRARALRAEVSPLEDRAPLAVTALTVGASPAVVTPLSPRNQPTYIPFSAVRVVTISGQVTTTIGRRPTVRVEVLDQFGRFNRARRIGPLTPLSDEMGRPRDFIYSVRVPIPLHRPATDPAGRTFTIIATATDGENGLSQATAIRVPRRAFPTVPHPPRTIRFR